MEPKKKPNQADTKQDREVCRALITPIADGTDWDFEAVAVPSENKQLRFSWENEEYFYQVLRTGKENIDTRRMDSGLPLFDNHPYDTSTVNQLGITVGYEFAAEGIVMRVKFGARADDQLKSDVNNKIVKTVSIEGSITNYTIERKQGEIPVYYADLWEPESLSFAPVPQDISAQIEVKRALKEQIERSKEPETTDNSLSILINKFK
jgi:hypothetical protein